MTQRWRRFKQSRPLEARLSAEATKLREQADRLPPGAEREHAMRRARQADVAAHLTDWLQSPGLQPPD